MNYNLTGWLPCEDHGKLPVIVNSWGDAERVAAQWVRRLGFPDAELTSAGADNGIDVVSVASATQVKWRQKRTGVDEVQRLCGAADLGQTCMFFSRKGYTNSALAWAFDRRVALFVLSPDGRIVGVNFHADRVVSKAPMWPAHGPEAVGPAVFIGVSGVCLLLVSLALATEFPRVIRSDRLWSGGWMIVVLVVIGMMLGLSITRQVVRRVQDGWRLHRRTGVWPGWRSFVDHSGEIRPISGPYDLFDGYRKHWLDSVVYYFKVLTDGGQGSFRTLAGWYRRRTHRIVRGSM